MALGIQYTNPGLPVTYTLDSDPAAFAGWGQTNAEIGSILFRTDVPSIYRKTGAGQTGWTLYAIASVSNAPFAFSYQVTGLEPDLTEFTITLPIPQSGSYTIIPFNQSVARIAAFDISGKISALFHLTTTGPLQAGDVISFFVIPG